ncbi:hypothetical protein AB0C96_33290 [Streptomyces sp. NPDC048506]|uniref:hypothetical protein n=1 Tax=Streptomyces sp. NPDC048506 TaxID=3155028 RepID=UPI00342D3C4C
MAEIPMLGVEELPESPHRDLVHALQELHRSAGWPGLRLISDAIRQGDFRSTLSHERLRGILQGRGGLPRWLNLEPAVRVLAAWCQPRRDPDDEARRIQACWLAAAEHANRGRGTPTSSGPAGSATPTTVAAPPVTARPAAAPRVSAPPAAATTGTAERAQPSFAPGSGATGAPRDTDRYERLVGRAAALEHRGRHGELRIELSRAGSQWDLEDVCGVVGYLRLHERADYLHALLNSAGRLRPVAEIAMLTERLTETEQARDAAIVLRAAGLRRPTDVPLALVERLRASGRRHHVRDVMVGAGEQRPVVLLAELLAMLEEHGYGDETRMALNATVHSRSPHELRELVDLLDGAGRTPQLQWLLDRIARERPAEAIAQFVHALGPAMRFHEVRTVLDIVARHATVNALITFMEALRDQGRGVSADHTLAAAGRHRSVPDLLLLMRWCDRHGREAYLRVMLDGADERGRKRFAQAAQHLRAAPRSYGIDVDGMLHRAGITGETLAAHEGPESRTLATVDRGVLANGPQMPAPGIAGEGERAADAGPVRTRTFLGPSDPGVTASPPE